MVSIAKQFAQSDALKIRGEELAFAKERLKFEEREGSRKADAAGASVTSAFFGAGLLWLIFGSVFLGVFIKLSQSIPFALVLGLVFVAILVWKGTK